MTERLTEAKKQLSRERQRARKRLYNQRFYISRRDDRPRCAICNGVMYGKGTAHVQCIVHQAESRVPE